LALSLTTRVKELRKFAKLLEENNDRTFDDALILMQPRVSHAWSENLKALEGGNAELAHLINVCSFLSNEDIPEEMLMKGIHGNKQNGT
jgi:hypothetical protein